MAPRRRSFGRVVVVAALVLLALFLLELHRFLPGSWPGGGGDGGSRRLPTSAGPDPSRVVPSETPPTAPIRADETELVRVVLRRHDGDDASEAGLEADPAGGAIVSRGRDGVPRVGPAAAGRAGHEVLVALGGGATLAHDLRPAVGRGDAIVVTPRATVSARAAAPRLDAPLAIRAVTPDGSAVGGALVEVTDADGEDEASAGPDGTATLPRRRRGLVRICASAPGHGEVCVVRRIVPGEPATIVLSPARLRTAGFADPATGADLVARSLTLVDATGARRRIERDGGVPRFEATIPDDIARATALEVDVAGRPLVRVPLASLPPTVEIPAGVVRTVVVTDEAGDPVAGAAVRARYPAGPGGESGDALETTETTDARGHAALALPSTGDADVVVEAPGLVVAGLRLSPPAAGEPPPLAVRLERGVAVRVEVRGPDGRPLPDADVLVLSAADRSTARRRVRTDAAGVASVPAIRPGRVEVLVHRAGTAWGAASGTAAEGAPPLLVRLAKGLPLTLVVEDPDGVPVAGVAVRAVPRADATGGTPDPADPDSPAWHTDEQGVLRAEDLSDRAVDLFLTKAGYEEEVLARVRPGPGVWFATLVPSRR